MTDDDRRPEDAGFPRGPEGPDAAHPADHEQPRPVPPVPPAHPASTDAGQQDDTTRFERPPAWQGYGAAPQAAGAAPYGAAPLDPPPPEGQERRRRGRLGKRGLVAAALVGVLALGGAAGLGGAAAYDALRGEDGTAPASTSQDYEATSTSVVEDGTVESVAESVLPSVVKVDVLSQDGAGSGSGIVLSEDGQILTNNHVIAGAEEGGQISVSFADGTTAEATVVGTDPLVDIAVIQAEDVEGLTPASIGRSGELNVGQAVVAVGSPFGLDATVTTGIVSALNRPVSVSGEQGQQNPFGGSQQPVQSTTYPAIQTDAAINPGNSGGPLVDMSGRVVGINSSIRSTGTAGGAAGSIGLGFAIPVDEVLPIVNQIANGETPTHARLGVSVGDTQAGPQGRVTGALISEVEPGGAADAAGLQTGDVVTRVDDQLIDGPDSLVATVRGQRPGDTVEVTFLRDGEEQSVQAELGSDAGQPSS